MMLRDRHFRTISSLSSPMIPHNAWILLGLLDSGQATLRRGVTEITRHRAGFTVTDDAEWTADVVINAVNPPAYTTPQDTESLMARLLDTGAAALAPTGGLHSDWHILGNLAADSMPIATNPPGLAGEAARLAEQLAKEAAREPSRSPAQPIDVDG